MDAPVSLKVDGDINEVRGFFLKIEDTSHPGKKRTVVKYAKLPDFELNSKVSWPKSNSYSLQPRLRRITELDDAQLQTTRSLKPNVMVPSRVINPTSYTKRKVVTITENEENNQSPNLSRTVKITNRATSTIRNDEKHATQRSTSRLTNPLKYSHETKQSAKTNIITNKKENSVSNASQRSKLSSNKQSSPDNVRTRNTKYREPPRNIKSSPIPPKFNISKNVVVPDETEQKIALINKELLSDLVNASPLKQPLEKTRALKSSQSKAKHELLRDIKSKTKPVNVIHVPLDHLYENKIELEEITPGSTMYYSGTTINKVDGSIDMGTIINTRDANVGGDQPSVVNRGTDTSDSQADNLSHLQNQVIQTVITNDVFDKLDIPNVTLTKEKSNYPKEELVCFCSQSLPNLQSPSLKISSSEEENTNRVGFSNTKSFIIGSATVTYTTKQKINFHVVGSSDDCTTNQSPSPLAYPLNVVSVLKNNLRNCNMSESSEGENLTNNEHKLNDHSSDVNELQAVNYSCVLNSNKLMKPSDLISNIRINNGLLHSDYICEQFQRELHFIDSFFESLQYLESCSLSDKCFSQDKCENWVTKTGFDFKNSDYNSFLSKLENGSNTLAHVDDIETMASKSLCLLNLLIRDEQRRAKNLLFVLKMREDALKDFTKSQIIWLENKKKQDNTDVSTLKKKQRGALLKLQHECGEMHRMRKALLTLSEKRKAALMKTRSNIELKLKNNVNVDQILLGKKKLKRNTAADRNVAPLKCFDLSSSGCDESVSSKPKVEVPTPSQEQSSAISSAEKCIQTGDSVYESIPLTNQTTNIAAENFVAVDGTYLNILFQNLSLPQIFSGGKQYEVNEEALRNIVNSSNNAHDKDLCDSDVIENFIDKIKSRECDRSTSPSTAHSLVDEYDQYYKGLSDGGKSPVDSPDTDYQNQRFVYEVKTPPVLGSDKQDLCEASTTPSSEVVLSDNTETTLNPDALHFDQPCACESLSSSVECQAVRGRDTAVAMNQAGPLPVPPGAASSPEPTITDGSDLLTVIPDSISASSAQLCPSVPSLTFTPAHSEAEELRRQQLAIEREIKALEQQQCQLLVVREIPDKPPPPYTPPSSQSHKLPRVFSLDEASESRIRRHLTHGEELDIDVTDPFGVFIQDICQESLRRQEMDQSDEPWDSCNLIPHKQEMSLEKIGEKAISDIKDLLSVVPPTVVSGVGARRSDHIDDILFAEWRRCEPEWTALHSEEATVKNQIFESVFQKVLSETVDQYKHTVLELTSEPIEQHKMSNRKQDNYCRREIEEVEEQSLEKVVHKATFLIK